MMNVEQIAVSAVSTALSRTDCLDPDFSTGDKQPSWDGDIKVYKSKSKSKSDLIIRIPVQIKGKIVQKIDEDHITYPIEVSDMKNYLHEGGAVYFVVLIDNNGENHRIFYTALLPFKLKELLKGKEMQSTINIKLNKLSEKRIK